MIRNGVEVKKIQKLENPDLKKKTENAYHSTAPRFELRIAITSCFVSSTKNKANIVSIENGQYALLILGTKGRGFNLG